MYFWGKLGSFPGRYLEPFLSCKISSSFRHWRTGQLQSVKDGYIYIAGSIKISLKRS